MGTTCSDGNTQTNPCSPQYLCLQGMSPKFLQHVQHQLILAGWQLRVLDKLQPASGSYVRQVECIAAAEAAEAALAVSATSGNDVHIPPLDAATQRPSFFVASVLDKPTHPWWALKLWQGLHVLFLLSRVSLPMPLATRYPLSPQASAAAPRKQLLFLCTPCFSTACDAFQPMYNRICATGVLTAHMKMVTNVAHLNSTCVHNSRACLVQLCSVQQLVCKLDVSVHDCRKIPFKTCVCTCGKRSGHDSKLWIL